MFSQVCVCPHLEGGYLPWLGVPTLAGGYLPWPGGVPTLAGGTYLGWGDIYLGRQGVPTLAGGRGYPPWPGQHREYLPCYVSGGMPLAFTQENCLVLSVFRREPPALVTRGYGVVQAAGGRDVRWSVVYLRASWTALPGRHFH